jgi:hypothetical protein
MQIPKVAELPHPINIWWLAGVILQSILMFVIFTKVVQRVNIGTFVQHPIFQTCACRVLSLPALQDASQTHEVVPSPSGCTLNMQDGYRQHRTTSLDVFNGI